MRIGHGYDVHKLVEGRKLVLGTIEIDHEKGLLGHSDADVLLHAIMDSLLGACGLGDIGKFFPDTDVKYKNISSAKLLCRVLEIIKKENYEIVNIDATIIAQKPKLICFIPKMKENIAKICNVNSKAINIKATTEEYLGFTGKEEGICAHAVCLLNEVRK